MQVWTRVRSQAQVACATVWLTLKEAEIRNGDWINPDDGKVSLAEYAETWIDERPGLRPKTVDLYRYLARKHLAQVLGPMPIADIQAGHVRRWRKHLLDAEVSAVTVAKAYRLLKTIMTTAADDGAIRRNPCRIKGGGGESSPERLVLTVPQVFALSEAIDPRYRALVLLATFTSLRWGELCALRPSDIDTEARTVRVERSLTELQNGALGFGPPKSDAGRRTVGFPELIAPVVRWHLSCFAPGGRRPRVHRPGWSAITAQQLPAAGLAGRAQESGAARGAFPRFAPYRKYPHRDCWGEPA
jgi:integrase